MANGHMPLSEKRVAGKKLHWVWRMYERSVAKKLHWVYTMFTIQFVVAAALAI